MSKALIFVPSHDGGVSIAALNSVIAAQSTIGNDYTFMVQGLSLLARNFNTAFLRAAGEGYDYFVMLHADIGIACEPGGPPGSWADILIGLCERNGAAVVSQAVPIKGPSGVLSAGLCLEAGNRHTLRRLTVSELERLPREIICRGDVCKIFGSDPAQAGAMLINTGCLVMDLRRFDWTNWDGFGIDDHIAWNRKRRGCAFTVPEDWRLSCWLHEKGWPYFLTNIFYVEHFGITSFSNRVIWGKPTDHNKPQLEPVVFVESDT